MNKLSFSMLYIFVFSTGIIFSQSGPNLILELKVEKNIYLKGELISAYVFLKNNNALDYEYYNIFGSCTRILLMDQLNRLLPMTSGSGDWSPGKRIKHLQTGEELVSSYELITEAISLSVKPYICIEQRRCSPSGAHNCFKTQPRAT